MAILDGINGPEDLKSLSTQQLTQLALEIRQFIIDILAKKGGHLASNLGAVELTVALHKVFDSPNDKFIFDTGHQSYTNKILTGRREDFHTICQYKGLSGFSNPLESKHDHFHSGHAGNALSLALGVARNRDLRGDDYYVVAVIGDASLTCGVTLEALNNCARNLKKFVVILNDNAMAISKNVGAITRILSHLLSNPTTNKIFQEMEGFISKIPGYGNSLTRQAHKISESLKHLVSEASYFEQFGLSYIGPIDGHNIKSLLETLEGVRNSQWPVVVHVLTKKGKGLPEAMKNPTTHHGAVPFDPQTGKFLPSTTKPTFPKIFGQHLIDQATDGQNVVAITPAMSFGSSLDPFMEQFPDRCIDVGIAESHATTFAGGVAYTRDMKIYAVIYSSFLQRALDNLFHDICLQNLPVVVAIDRAGLASYGASHHGIYDISFLQAMPNMVIAQPRNGQILIELMESAFDWQCPVAIRYPNAVTEPPQKPLAKRLPGKGEVIAKGKELLIIALGNMCTMAMDVKERLAQHGVTATVLDPIFIKPLDHELLHDLLVTHKQIVTIEEHALSGGFGSIINDFLMRNGYNDVQVLNFGIPDTFVGHGNCGKLLEEIGVTAEHIANKSTEYFSLPKTRAEVIYDSSTLSEHN